MHFLFSTIPSRDRSNPYEWPASHLSLAATSNQNVIQSASNNDLNSSQLSSSQLLFNPGPDSNTSPLHAILDQVLNETQNLSQLPDLYQPAPLDFSSQFFASDIRLPSKKRKLNRYDWCNN